MIDKSVFLSLWLGDRSEENRARVVAEHRYLSRARPGASFAESPTGPTWNRLPRSA